MPEVRTRLLKLLNRLPDFGRDFQNSQTAFRTQDGTFKALEPSSELRTGSFMFSSAMKQSSIPGFIRSIPIFVCPLASKKACRRLRKAVSPSLSTTPLEMEK